MKTILYFMVLFACCQVQLNAQITITLTFSGIQNGLNQPLDSINIENLTQGGDTTLNAPDTLLELTYIISGIHDPHSRNQTELWFSPAYTMANTGAIQVWLFMPKQGRVLLRLFDLAGIEHAVLTEQLPAGQHCFNIHAGVKTFLILSAESNGRITTCKIAGSGLDEKRCRIEYAGLKDHITAKIQKGTFPWFPSDLLKFTGYASGYSDTIIDNPIQSRVYVFLIPDSYCPPTITDTSGNIYNTVQIGYQCWLRENLRARHYNNGAAIPNITSDNSWQNLTTGALCWYNNDSASYFNSYGTLYNWHAVNSGQLCPTGWHIPGDDEIKTLEIHLGMTQAQADSIAWRGNDEGGKLKEAGTVHWNAPNTGASNTSGLTLLPGGCRFGSGGYFNHIGNYCYLWTATAYSTQHGWIRELSNNSQKISRIYPLKTFGFSVRCIKDT